MDANTPIRPNDSLSRPFSIEFPGNEIVLVVALVIDSGPIVGPAHPAAYRPRQHGALSGTSSHHRNAATESSPSPLRTDTDNRQLPRFL
jgi:hypothetical protein